jgi:hypothetical protein
MIKLKLRLKFSGNEKKQSLMTIFNTGFGT